MKITILGCGTSTGVPTITGDWGVCDKNNLKNYRTRQSVIINYNNKNVLIDTSTDMRYQFLREKIKKLDAILFTHAHADHCHGLDDVRDFYLKSNKRIPIFANKSTMDELYKKFNYMFDGKVDKQLTYPALIESLIIKDSFDLFGKKIIPFEQDHGIMESLGFRIDDFAYSTDVVNLNEDAFETLNGTKIWLVECLQKEEHKTHAWLEKTLSWIEKIKPEKAYLIHMNNYIDYNDILKYLPENVLPAYDGLTINL